MFDRSKLHPILIEFDTVIAYVSIQDGYGAGLALSVKNSKLERIPVDYRFLKFLDDADDLERDRIIARITQRVKDAERALEKAADQKFRSSFCLNFLKEVVKKKGLSKSLYYHDNFLGYLFEGVLKTKVLNRYDMAIGSKKIYPVQKFYLDKFSICVSNYKIKKKVEEQLKLNITKLEQEENTLLDNIKSWKTNIPIIETGIYSFNVGIA